MQGSSFVEFVRKRWLLLLIVVVTMLVLWLSSIYGFITVSVTESNSELTYQILNQKTQQSKVVKTSSKTIKQLVKKSDYQVLIKEAGRSAFLVTRTSGWFKNTSTSAALKSENKRQFVGGNPKSCMYYSVGMLYTYDCDGSISSAQTHVPAKASQPSYVQNNTAGGLGYIEGLIKTTEGELVLVNNPETDETTGSHSIHKLSGGFNLDSGVILSDLNTSKNYKIEQYKAGFLVYDTEFGNFLYYLSSSAKPQQITIEKPSDEELKPYLLSAAGESVIIMYSDKADFEENTNPDTIGKVKSELVISRGGESKHYSFDKRFDGVIQCGASSLCMLNGAELFVYKTGGDEPSLQYKIVGVSSMMNTARGLLVTLADGYVLNMDVNNMNGYISYSFGEYEFCGQQSTTGGYLLCVTNEKGKNAALYVDQASNNSDFVDRKIFELQRVANIRDVTAYGGYIFISPDFGPLIYDSSNNGYGYNPVTKQSIIDAVNQRVDELDIDRKVYQITIVGAQ